VTPELVSATLTVSAEVVLLLCTCSVAEDGAVEPCVVGLPPPPPPQAAMSIAQPKANGASFALNIIGTFS
jgi:hypothetical protein